MTGNWLALATATSIVLLVMGGAVLRRRPALDRIAWTLVAAAFALIAVTLALGFLPRWGTATEHVSEPKRVNCGSVFLSTKWKADEGCYGVWDVHLRAMTYSGLVGLAAGLVGGGFLVAKDVRAILARAAADDSSN